MFKTIALLVSVALIAAFSISTFGQTSNADKIKKAVAKIGVKGDITVVRSDDQWFYGTVEKIDDTSLTIYDIEQKMTANFSFDQVKKVYKGYGEGGAIFRDIHGHRIPPQRHHIGLAIGAAIIAAVLIIAVVALKKD
ncbi:MAG: hypothetical protein JO314_01870 [Acidobacteria bacterium]|nr:hypothetical protein [Acidobacteriota bacterium]